ncbi:MAG: hypothetical protein WCI55_06065 [Armatimonadota bacterium]
MLDYISLNANALMVAFVTGLALVICSMVNSKARKQNPETKIPKQTMSIIWSLWAVAVLGWFLANGRANLVPKQTIDRSVIDSRINSQTSK